MTRTKDKKFRREAEARASKSYRGPKFEGRLAEGQSVYDPGAKAGYVTQSAPIDLLQKELDERRKDSDDRGREKEVSKFRHGKKVAKAGVRPL